MKWLLVLSIFVMIYYRAHLNTYHPDINYVNLKLKSKNKTNPLNILHLSDFHMEKISISADQLHDSLKEKDIDLIALTGDYLERVKNIDKFLNYIEALKKLEPKYGIYAVFGNHDYLLRKKLFLLQDALEAAGVIILRNENRIVELEGSHLNIIGIDDFKTKRSDLNKSYKGITDGINLVLTHDPNIVLNMRDYHYDYLLSGHFHGGQIHWPKPFHLAKMGKLARRNIFRGLNYHDDKPFYINEGLGQTALNIRLRSRPEITLHILT